MDEAAHTQMSILGSSTLGDTRYVDKREIKISVMSVVLISHYKIGLNLCGEFIFPFKPVA